MQRKPSLIKTATITAIVTALLTIQYCIEQF